MTGYDPENLHQYLLHRCGCSLCSHSKILSGTVMEADCAIQRVNLLVLGFPLGQVKKRAADWKGVEFSENVQKCHYASSVACL
jgi:hypothetical protein